MTGTVFIERVEISLYTFRLWQCKELLFYVLTLIDVLILLNLFTWNTMISISTYTLFYSTIYKSTYTRFLYNYLLLWDERESFGMNDLEWEHCDTLCSLKAMCWSDTFYNNFEMVNSMDSTVHDAYLSWYIPFRSEF